jgi:hypothetical protein
MTRDAQPKIATVTVLAIALGIAAFRTGGLSLQLPVSSEATPSDAIYSMLDAAKAGDINRYLAAFTGEQQQSLRRIRSESRDFAQYLRDSNVDLKGVAVMEPQSQTEARVRVRVEYVYQDRNEAQDFLLEKNGSSWKIAGIENAERTPTLIPWGTPVQ